MKNWSSLKELFSKINASTEYVVIRNYETLENEITNSTHPDIDILCKDRKAMLNVIDSLSRTKRKNDELHRYVLINDKKVDVDLRYIGDGYLDDKWEENILQKREMYNEMFYVPNRENYYYSLMYHALIQKKTMSPDYREKLSEIGKEVSQCEGRLDIEELQNYMRNNGYMFTYSENSRALLNFNLVDKTMIKKDIIKSVKYKIWHL